MEGKCTCGQIRYRLTQPPLFVHACHCTWCQRETGSAFALNAMIETEFLHITGTPQETLTPSNSGQGQIIIRCPNCHVALYSHYGARRTAAFVRVGTLDHPAQCPPDIHIFTSTKQPWLVLDGRLPVMAEYYDRNLYWPAASLGRGAVLRSKG